MNQKESLTLGYVGKPSRRMTLFAEMKGSQDISDTLVGCRLKFQDAQLTGTFTSSFKAACQYKHMLEGVVPLQFSSQIDFNKPEKPVVFGVSLSVGGGF